MGFFATLGFLIAAGALYATSLVYLKAAPAAVAEKPKAAPRASLRPAVTVSAPETSPAAEPPVDPGRQALLASQPDAKRNQILVVDLFLQILGRYPNAQEQAQWLPPESPGARRLLEMRRRGDSDAAIANHIAGSLLELSAKSGRFPLIQVPRSGKAWERVEPPGDGAAYLGAMLARGLGVETAAQLQDAALVRRVADEYRLPLDGEAPLEAVEAMLRDLAASSDVVDHLRDEGTSPEVELDAIRNALRLGRLVVVNGADSRTHSRDVLFVGFDGEGNFLSRDPTSRMPPRWSAAALKAFMSKPGLEDAAPGFWIELPGRRGKCRRQALAAALPAGLDSLLLDNSEDGKTGALPGAEVELTPLRIPPGEHTVRGTLSMTADQIDRVLADGDSPAAGTGASFVRWGRYYNIDPVFALAFFRRESLYGTHPKWVGRIDSQASTRDIGNIRYTGKPSPLQVPQYSEFNGFRAYASWDDGIHDWFKLLAQDSNYAGLHTVERILPVYAPRSENDTANYVRDVLGWVEEWRAQSRTALAEAHVQAPVARSDPSCE